jgi:hypothetical protein
VKVEFQKMSTWPPGWRRSTSLRFRRTPPPIFSEWKPPAMTVAL